MRILLVLILVLGIGVLGFKIHMDISEEKMAHKSPLNAFPSNPLFLMEINEITSNWNHFTETNMIWSEFISNKDVKDNYSSVKEINNFLNDEFIAPIINDGKVYVCGYNLNGKIEWLLIKNNYQYEKTNNSHKLNDSILSNALPSKNCHSKYISPFIALSSNKELLERAYNNLKNKNLTSKKLPNLKTEKLISNSSSFSCFLDVVQVNEFLFSNDSSYGHYFSENKGLNNWLQFDFNYTPNAINIIGVSDCFNKKLQYNPQYINNPNLIPDQMDVLSKQRIKYHFDKFDELNDENEKASITEMEILHIKLSNQLTKTKEHIVFIERPNDIKHEAYFMNKITSDSAVSKQLGSKEIKLVDTIFLKSIYDINYSSNQFCFVDNQYLIFSTYNGLKEWDYQLKQKKKLSIEESIFADKSSSFTNQAFSQVDYWSGKELKKALNLFLNSTPIKNDLINEISGVSWATSFLNDGYLHHAINIQKGLHKEEDQKILWTALATPLIKGPYVMKNHKSGTKDIFIQDTSNIISLFSASGKLKWQLNIEQPIIGSVSQIDIYNNNKWQMVFNTSKKLYVIDINGNYVKGFPLDFNYLATNEVGVIDYDLNKNYRFLISGNDGLIHNYNKYGEKVKGWILPKIQSLVNLPVQHFSIAGKDYVFVYETNGSLRFLNRKGQERAESIKNINIKSSSGFVVQKSYSFDKSSLIYIDTNGRLKNIGFDGVFSDLQFNLDSNKNFIPFICQIPSSSVNYAFVSKDKLLIMDSKNQTYLDKESNYNLLNNVLINNNYLTLYNEQNEEIQLIDSKFKELPTVFRGTKKCTISDLNNDGVDELITVVNESTLLCYQIAPSN
ncbi:MAG: hypothetical protein CL846_03550 [Crocinitomicaceae bacterium]|nr:hypothetical protein [Crocinitomicaceae bacterium]|tara:strand:+ start:425 stop:2953 length:2529 start_codon:yes stop_codon:yes gene_type:complete